MSRAVSVLAPDDMRPALAALGLTRSRPVIVVVGGASGVGGKDLARLRPLFDEALLPVAMQVDAAVVDGGTLSGVMRALGESHARAPVPVPLVGVAVAGTVRAPQAADPAPDTAELDPHHTHFVLVPGSTWGEESPWLTLVARTLAGSHPSVTVVMNGGEITLDDVTRSVEAGRPVLVVDGSGRAADDLAAALAGGASNERLTALAASGLLTVVPVDDPAALARALAAALEDEPRPKGDPA
jgi:TRPM family ion channel